MDKFTEAYIECALWSSKDEDGEPPDYLAVHDIAHETLKGMIADCEDFQEANSALLDSAPAWYTDEHAGQDFWLTRNRHGAGFWDRGLGKLGDELTEAARPYGSVDLYVDEDGMVRAQ